MFHYKVLNPSAPNSISQMKSGEYQPPFIAGGNQVAYNLGLRGNNITSTNTLPSHASEWSATERMLRSRR
jgi:hypothetical protein